MPLRTKSTCGLRRTRSVSFLRVHLFMTCLSTFFIECETCSSLNVGIGIWASLPPSSSVQKTVHEGVGEGPYGLPRNVTLLQVQIVHRHGDRTPVTPLQDEDFWRRTLPATNVLRRIAVGTRLVRNAPNSAHAVDDGKRHGAYGRGPFGQLTTLGLLQMVNLGSKLRKELVHEEERESWDGLDGQMKAPSSLRVGERRDGMAWYPSFKLFWSSRPLIPRRIRVRSTDFPRTIQSVQGLLVGLFPDGLDGQSKEEIEVDVRRTKFFIPDPQPRNSPEQEELESKLVRRRHILDREEEMRPLAIRTTAALRGILAYDSRKISFGTGEDPSEDLARHASKEEEFAPLPWSQLAEICKCLRVRNVLPTGLTHTDEEEISSHSAWRWFENMRHPRLAWLAMRYMIQEMVNCVEEGMKHCPWTGSSRGTDDAALLHIYSAHDSTLIGLLCAFRLEQPAEWPEYGSYLKIELLAVEVEDVPVDVDYVENADDEMDEKNIGRQNSSTKTSIRHFVRFSLNGTVLRCHWGGVAEREPFELVPVEVLRGFLDASGEAVAVNETKLHPT